MQILQLEKNACESANQSSKWFIKFAVIEIRWNFVAIIPKFQSTEFILLLSFSALLADQIQQYFGSLKLHSSDLDISIQQHWWKNDSFSILLGDLASFYLHDYGVSVKYAFSWMITFFWIMKWLKSLLIGSTLMSLKD